MLHLIPDDGFPHAPTSECGCGPVLVRHAGRLALTHPTRTDLVDEPGMGAPAAPDMGDHVDPPAAAS